LSGREEAAEEKVMKISWLKPAGLVNCTLAIVFGIVACAMALGERLAASAIAAEALGKVERVSDESVREPIAIPSDGETLRGWLYLPSNYQPGTKLPGIVTANALSGIKEINLVQYAERFAAAGFATLVFDYRYWGKVPASRASILPRWSSERT
jgi:hypothetical protein